MPRRKKTVTSFKRGDRVLINQCPKYSYACGSHKAKIIGDPVQSSDGGWVAPIRFNCIGIAYANYPCKYMLKREGILNNVKLTRPAIVTLVVLGVVAFTGLWFAGNYNDLVRSRNQVNNTRAQVDTEFTRRYDLIDNIVQSVQGSQAQESDVFGKIAEARKMGGNAGDPGTEVAANNAIDTQIALLPRLQEAYPELRSNEQVTRLIQELQGTNNTIRDKKNAYNDTVTNYNNNITSFPKNIFAGIFNFDKEELYKATAEERVNPKVELDRERN